MIVMPVASTMRAPAGVVTSAPTASILPFLTTSVPRSITDPDTVTRRAFVNAEIDEPTDTLSAFW